MLNLREFRSRVKGLPDLLPYAALVDPGIVLNKDGSLMAAWTIRGEDTASCTTVERHNIAFQFNNAVVKLKSGCMLHVDSMRVPHETYPDASLSHFPDPVSQLIEDERRTFFTKIDHCYVSNTILCLTYKPSFQDNKMRAMLQEGGADRQFNELAKSLELFKAIIKEFEDATSSILILRRLEEYTDIDEDDKKHTYSNLLSYIQACVSGEMHPIKVPDLVVPMYLDGIIASENLTGGLEPRIGDQHICILGVDGMPQESYPMMLTKLESLDVPYRWSTRFIALDSTDSQKEVDRYRKNWRQQIFKLFDQIFNKVNPRPNREALRMAEEAEDALLVIQSGEMSAGFMTTNIVLMHEDRNVLEDSARELRRAIQALGFGCRMETINAMEAWLGTHPGNSWSNVRRPLIISMNLAHFLPLASIWTGSEYNPCPFYPPNSPCLSVFTTDGRTPFWYNMHVGDVGQTLILGPPGSGKSTLLSLKAAQFRRYNGQVFAFDKGLSMLPLCLGVGGSHYNIGHGLSFAPLATLGESPAIDAWARSYVESMLSLQLNYPLNPGQRAAVHDALTDLGTNPLRLRTMTGLNNILMAKDQELGMALRHYTLLGGMGSLLDASPTDASDLSMDPFMVFEIEDLMGLGDANVLPVLFYLFHRIEQALDGRPTMLLLDEAWVMLKHAAFKAQIVEWLKVMRKRNCAVVLATQSISDAAQSGILDVLTESCVTKIYLANPAAQEDSNGVDYTPYKLYTSMGLNDRQIRNIAQARPKRDYYITSPLGRRMVNLALGPETLAFCGVSGKEDIARIRDLHKAHGQGWSQVWLKERGVA